MKLKRPICPGATACGVILAGRIADAHDGSANGDVRLSGFAVPRLKSASVHVAVPVLRKTKNWFGATSPLSSVM